MTIKIDSSISIISLITIVIFGVSFFFNVGVLTQISASKFLENNDDKKKLLKDAKDRLYDFKTDAFKKIICVFPYFLTLVFCYSVSPLIVNFLGKYLSSFLPKKYDFTLFMFFILFEMFAIGEALFGLDEKYIERKDYRIYYNRPSFRIIFIFCLYFGSKQLDNIISIELKQSILSFLHIYSFDSFQLIFIFSYITFFNDLFIVKLITRYIVLFDQDIYLECLKEKNKYYSFYGMANLFLSLLMIIASAYLNIKYSIWKNDLYFAAIWSALMILPLSMLAGQRDYSVSLARKMSFSDNKQFYTDVHGKKRLVKF